MIRKLLTYSTEKAMQPRSLSVCSLDYLSKKGHLRAVSGPIKSAFAVHPQKS